MERVHQHTASPEGKTPAVPAVRSTTATVQRAPTTGFGHNLADISIFPPGSSSAAVQRVDDGSGGGAPAPAAGQDVLGTLAANGLSVSPGFVRASGVMQVDTIIANSVVGASYTPGVGNLQ